ncbi:DUF3626 domain-containing protein [Amycolatopsis mongoliensis]|uniref:DUF3626 domain-containing protein n=1 Tax=Amycolatopsis mongoliensis TaxID=715475 RepID=A0A9Y2NBR2_9PSEU|nr:DUF3626 domain-containing protein [Amycolatopsis sp. 4-36]WIX99910.1 DUF3626 domain-containing protein [Amycolatopsis sp. 4-36]
MVRGTEPWRRAVEHIGSRVAGPRLPGDLDVTVHFHPDRLVGEVPLLRHLVTDGVYRSQFETGTSNGGLTAHAGGARRRWEHRMFGGAYDDLPPSARPKYGSLNYRRRPAGGSVRFGSSHFRLKRQVLTRTTFCYPDSSAEPEDFGTAERMPLLPLAEEDTQDELDDHIEAHVHGPLRLATDVEALVLDPAFRGTDVEAAAAGLPFPTFWHHGFRLPVEVLAEHADFRGEDVVRAGQEIARDGRLDARVIGDAVRAGRHDPQVLKRVWHCTARFGLRGDAGG